ncbi:hypothetical protein BC830DRAFT_1155354 [Chytriomyces sp. MP71]|nr:hypothetical protein BC830DRAFT_1155354 [Chytriomyces sp. MP71]
MKSTVTLSLACCVSIVAAYNWTWAPAAVSASKEVGNHVAGVPAWTQWFGSSAVADLQQPALAGDVKTCVSSSGTKVWGSSFDDGPSDSTPKLLAYLAAKKIKLTFWVIGYNVLTNADILKQTYQSGHDIGIHTWSHPHLTQLSDDEVIAELVYGARSIYEVLGVWPRYFRPPYGDADGRVRKLAALVGLTSVTWSRDSQDWVYYGNTTALNTVIPANFRGWIGSGTNNDISLEHDFASATVDVGIKVLDMLLTAGYTIKPLSECLGGADPYNNTILTKFFASGLFESKLGPVLTATPTGRLGFGAETGTVRVVVASQAATSSASSVSEWIARVANVAMLLRFV